MAPIISLYTGQPFTVTDGTDVSLTGDGLDRPNVILGVPQLPHTLASWFNPAAFAGSCALAAYAGNPNCQTPGTFGNAPRDVFHNPGTIQFDIALSRQFKFKERYRFDLRADFFNVMNHANWNGPSAAINSSTFGQITSFGGPRLIQLATKFFF